MGETHGSCVKIPINPDGVEQYEHIVWWIGKEIIIQLLEETSFSKDSNNTIMIQPRWGCNW